MRSADRSASPCWERTADQPAGPLSGGERFRATLAALLLASHDLPFLRGVGITRWLRLDGRLFPVDPA